jgi:hypothetical protein
MRLLRTLAISGSAAVAAGALTLAMASTATTTVASHSTARTPSVHFLAEARLSLLHYLRHNHPTMVRAPHTSRIDARGLGNVSTEGSYNWSGYAVQSTKDQAFTSVKASWVQPKVTCTSEDRMAATWVGLDGANNGTVEQDGSTGWCFEGKAVYFTWYEMYPAGSIEVGKSLKPGDKITATVSRSGSKYTLTVKDATHTSASFTKKASCALGTCLDQSIEWIMERPAWSTTGIMPLAVYNGWKATGVTGGQVKGVKTTTEEITMIDSTATYALSVPSGLHGGVFSTAFKDTY